MNTDQQQSSLPRHIQPMDNRAKAIEDLETLIEMAAQFNGMSKVLATAASIKEALGLIPAPVRRERVWSDEIEPR